MEDEVAPSESDSGSEAELQQVRTLPLRSVFSYGVGHFYNDLCASMWFTYLLLFLKKVLKFSSPAAGYVLLIGQLTDGIATPLVGIEIDNRRFRRMISYGQRKSWHLVGTIFVTVSFPFLFVDCIGCNQYSHVWAKLIYYVPFVVIFQIGWATVQISHLALIPDISSSKRDRTTLNGLRYAFTVLANLAVFGLAWVMLGLDSSHEYDVTPHDAFKFEIMGFVVIGLGLVFAITFHVGTNEHRARRYYRQRGDSEASDDGTGRGTEGDLGADGQSVDTFDSVDLSGMRHWRDWLCDIKLYQMGILYVCTRLFVNISQVYMPLYILESQHFKKEYIAIIPLIAYVSSLITSVVLSLRAMNLIVARRRIIYAIGVILGLGSCTWMWFHNLHWKIFGVAVLLGCASALLLITSLAMVSDMIGPHTRSSAFVFGAMSLCDKIANGVAIQAVQSLEPICTKSCPVKDWYFRDVMVLVPGSALVVAAIVLVSFCPPRIPGRVVRDMHHRELIEESA